MTLRQQDIHHAELVDVSMLLELGPDLCPDLRYRHVERIHLLDLRGLYLEVIGSVFGIKIDHPGFRRGGIVVTDSSQPFSV